MPLRLRRAWGLFFRRARSSAPYTESKHTARRASGGAGANLNGRQANCGPSWDCGPYSDILIAPSRRGVRLWPQVPDTGKLRAMVTLKQGFFVGDDGFCGTNAPPHMIAFGRSQDDLRSSAGSRHITVNRARRSCQRQSGCRSRSPSQR